MPFARDNIDTDQILPARFLHLPRDADHGACLFRDLRYRPDGTVVEDFPLNRPAWQQGAIALGGENFACGSSRENAVWAMHGHGFRAVIAPSYGDIFAQNGLKNGLLPVRLPAATVPLAATLTRWILVVAPRGRSAGPDFGVCSQTFAGVLRPIPR